MADTVCTPAHVMSLRALLHRATSVPHPSAGTSVHVRRDSPFSATRSLRSMRVQSRTRSRPLCLSLSISLSGKNVERSIRPKIRPFELPSPRSDVVLTKERERICKVPRYFLSRGSFELLTRELIGDSRALESSDSLSLSLF